MFHTNSDCPLTSPLLRCEGVLVWGGKIEEKRKEGLESPSNPTRDKGERLSNHLRKILRLATFLRRGCLIGEFSPNREGERDDTQSRATNRIGKRGRF